MAGSYLGLLDRHALQTLRSKGHERKRELERDMRISVLPYVNLLCLFSAGLNDRRDQAQTPHRNGFSKATMHTPR